MDHRVGTSLVAGHFIPASEGSMKLQVPFLQLPVAFDAEILAQEISALGESAWRPHPQGFAGNSAIPLVSENGDPQSDAVRGAMRPTPQLESCPYLLQVMSAIGGVWGRSRLMRLSGQAEVTAHVDIDYYWRDHMRVHVPIITQADVQFHCGDAVINMAAGECWIFDTWRLHRVLNSADAARIHLVADSVGGPGLWNLVASARPHHMTVPGWQPRRIGPDPGASTTLRLESVNVPDVMSPWELQDHLEFLLDESQPHPNLSAIHHLVGHFHRHWRSLWAMHGSTHGGASDYREAIRLFAAEMVRLGEGVRLQNGTTLLTAMHSLVT
ncbi:MAG: aspartyl/asparaginyl beta-hydroxylase domain-containing protein, partial [Dokdonella sp.]